jgi:NAD(P)-dependent dehydrogenase (short-subunit alcohol dehydrogenase family)
MINAELHGRVALVTGATRGVGAAAGQLFAAAGAWVAVNYRTDLHGAKRLVDVIRSAGGRALLVPGDVRTQAGAWTVARYVEHEWAQIDLVLHAAPLLGADETVLDHRPLLAELAPGMHERGWGRIVIFNPADAVTPGPALSGCWSAPGVFVNLVLLPGGDRLAPSLAEAAARAALFLGSGWNLGVTGAVLTINAAVDAQDPVSAPESTP